MPGARLSMEWRVLEELVVLRDFLNFTVPNAGRADPHPLAGAFNQGPHRLQIDIPPTFGDVMSVTDAVAELRPATANLTNLCHKTELS